MSLLDAIERKNRGITANHYIERETSFTGVAGNKKEDNPWRNGSIKGPLERKAEALFNEQKKKEEQSKILLQNFYKNTENNNARLESAGIRTMKPNISEIAKSAVDGAKKAISDYNAAQKQSEEELALNYDYLTEDYITGEIGGYDRNKNKKLDVEEVELYTDLVSQLLLKGIYQPTKLVTKGAKAGLAKAWDSYASASNALLDAAITRVKRNLGPVPGIDKARNLKEAFEIESEYRYGKIPPEEQSTYFYDMSKATFGKWADDLYKESQEYAQNAYGKVGAVLNDVVVIAGQMAPTIVAAAATSGASVPTSLAGYGSSVTKIVELLKIPTHMLPSFIQQMGSSYDKSMQEGVAPDKALAFSIIDAYASTLLEKGGVEGSIAAGKPGGLWPLIKDSISEGGEEVGQNITSASLRKIAGLNDAPIYSTTDEDAVLNPKRDTYAAGMGTLAGGIMKAGTDILTGNTGRKNANANTDVDNLSDARDNTEMEINARNAEEQKQYLKQIKEVMGSNGGEVGNQNLQKEVGSYDGKDMETIKREYEAAVDPSLANFAQYAISNPNDNKSAIQLNDVTDRQAADIKRLTGIDTNGFGAEAKANTFRHIDEGHGQNGTTDHSMADINDVARMQYVTLPLGSRSGSP